MSRRKFDRDDQDKPITWQDEKPRGKESAELEASNSKLYWIAIELTKSNSVRDKTKVELQEFLKTLKIFVVATK